MGIYPSYTKEEGEKEGTQKKLSLIGEISWYMVKITAASGRGVRGTWLEDQSKEDALVNAVKACKKNK